MQLGEIERSHRKKKKIFIYLYNFQQVKIKGRQTNMIILKQTLTLIKYGIVFFFLLACDRFTFIVVHTYNNRIETN